LKKHFIYIHLLVIQLLVKMSLNRLVLNFCDGLGHISILMPSRIRLQRRYKLSQEKIKYAFCALIIRNKKGWHYYASLF